MEPSFTTGDEDYEAPLMSPPPAAVPSVVDPSLGLRLLFPRLGRTSSASNDIPDNVPAAVTNARRCLFPGPRPTSDEMAAFIDEQLAREREDAKRKWNFDFEKLEPLPGRYLWEPVFTVDLNVEGSRTDVYNDPVVFGDGEVNQRTARRRQGVDESVITPTVGVPSRPGVEERLSVSVDQEGASSSNDGVDQSGSISPSGRSRQSRITEHLRPVRRTLTDQAAKPLDSADMDDPSSKRRRQE